MTCDTWTKMNLVHGVMLSPMLIGTWMTHGRFSKNATFSIHNYFSRALYRKHLCQKGRDDLIREELYQGMSKGAEGYAMCLTFKIAKDEGMNIAIQW